MRKQQTCKGRRSFSVHPVEQEHEREGLIRSLQTYRNLLDSHISLHLSQIACCCDFPSVFYHFKGPAHKWTNRRQMKTPASEKHPRHTSASTFDPLPCFPNFCAALTRVWTKTTLSHRLVSVARFVFVLRFATQAHFVLKQWLVTKLVHGIFLLLTPSIISSLSCLIFHFHKNTAVVILNNFPN